MDKLTVYKLKSHANMAYNIAQFQYISCISKKVLKRKPVYSFSCVLVWDTRPPKGPQQGTKEKAGPKNPMGVPDTFKHLDLTWKPMLKVKLVINLILKS